HTARISQYGRRRITDGECSIGTYCHVLPILSTRFETTKSTPRACRRCVTPKGVQVTFDLGSRHSAHQRALYVQNNFKTFYYASSCSRDDERSEESREHDTRATPDRVSTCNGRRRAWDSPGSCSFIRTAD